MLCSQNLMREHERHRLAIGEFADIAVSAEQQKPSIQSRFGALPLNGGPRYGQAGRRVPLNLARRNRSDERSTSRMPALTLNLPQHQPAFR